MPTVVTTARSCGNRLKKKENGFRFEFSEGRWRLVNDGSRATVREEFVGLLAPSSRSHRARATPHVAADARAVRLGCMVAPDTALLNLADLPLGWAVISEGVAQPWQRTLNASGSD